MPTCFPVCYCCCLGWLLYFGITLFLVYILLDSDLRYGACSDYGTPLYSFDMERFKGKWFEVARTDNRLWESKGECVYWTVDEFLNNIEVGESDVHWTNPCELHIPFVKRNINICGDPSSTGLNEGHEYDHTGIYGGSANVVVRRDKRIPIEDGVIIKDMKTTYYNANGEMNETPPSSFPIMSKTRSSDERSEERSSLHSTSVSSVEFPHQSRITKNLAEKHNPHASSALPSTYSKEEGRLPSHEYLVSNEHSKEHSKNSDERSDERSRYWTDLDLRFDDRRKQSLKSQRQHHSYEQQSKYNIAIDGNNENDDHDRRKSKLEEPTSVEPSSEKRDLLPIRSLLWAPVITFVAWFNRHSDAIASVFGIGNFSPPMLLKIHEPYHEPYRPGKKSNTGKTDNFFYRFLRGWHSNLDGIFQCQYGIDLSENRGRCHIKWAWWPFFYDLRVVNTDYQNSALLYSCMSFGGFMKYEYAWSLRRSFVSDSMLQADVERLREVVGHERSVLFVNQTECPRSVYWDFKDHADNGSYPDDGLLRKKLKGDVTDETMLYS